MRAAWPFFSAATRTFASANSLAAAKNDLRKLDRRAANSRHARFDAQQVVDGRRGKKLDFQSTHGEQQTLFARKRAVLEAERAQPFGAPSLHKAQIRGVIDAAGKIRVLVVHAQVQVLTLPSARHRARVSAASNGASTDPAKLDRARPCAKRRMRSLTLLARNAKRAAMRIVFMGAPEFATPTLSALLEQGHEVVAVYTRAPKPAGRRGLEIAKTPVHRARRCARLARRDDRDAAHARSAGRVPRLRSGRRGRRRLRAHPAAAVLAAPKFGCLNVHASLLPRWRGAAPIQRAIMAGDAETGVDLMRIEEGLDTGPVALEARAPIRPGDTAGDLTAILAALGAKLIAKRLPGLAAGRLDLSPAERARARRTRARSKRAKRRSIGRPTRSACATTFTGSPPRPAPIRRDRMRRTDGADRDSARRRRRPQRAARRRPRRRNDRRLRDERDSGRRSPARRQVRDVRRGTHARRANRPGDALQPAQRRPHPRAELALHLLLGAFRRAQDLTDAEEIEHAELLDGGPHEDVGRAHLELLRGDRALHDLRGAEHRLERRRHPALPRAAAERHVDRDDDIGVIEQEIIGQAD